MTNKEKILDYITKNSPKGVRLTDIWADLGILITDIDPILQELEKECKIDVKQSAGHLYFMIL